MPEGNFRPFERRGKPKTGLSPEEASDKGLAFATISKITAHTKDNQPGEVRVLDWDGSIMWHASVPPEGATFQGVGTKLTPGGRVTGPGGVTEIEVAGQEIQQF